MNTNIKPHKITSIRNKNKYLVIYATVPKTNETFDRGDT